MSRQNVIAPPPGRAVAHRLHTIRSFSEQLTLGSFEAAASPPTPVLEKVFYTRANVLYKCDPDLTNHETVFTWVGEAAGGIQGIAIDHANERVLMSGFATDDIHGCDYDGSNDAKLLDSLTNIDASSMLIVDEGNAKVVYGSLGNLNWADVADGANNEEYVNVNAYPVAYDATNDRYIYGKAASPDTFEYVAAGLTAPQSGTAISAATSANTLYGIAYDTARDQIWYGESASRINFMDDPYGSPAATLNWFNQSSVFRGLAYDSIGDQLYGVSRAAAAGQNGLFIFTDLDEATSTAHAAAADHGFGDSTQNANDVALQYDISPQGPGAVTSGTATMTHTIPAGAYVVRVAVKVIEGFAGDTTAVAVIGDEDDEDRYVVASFDVKAASPTGKAVGKPSGKKDHPRGKKPKVKVTAGSAFANLTGGTMLVTVYYVEP